MFNRPAQLAAAVKAVPITLTAVRPIDEAISSVGGMLFDAMTPRLMLEALPGVFCTGEKLDWEAPHRGLSAAGLLCQQLACRAGCAAIPGKKIGRLPSRNVRNALLTL